LTSEIALTLSILLIATVLFITERLRVDLVALLVLGSLALTGIITPDEALAGFSNPAVVTVWAVFMLSAGLARTGIASVVGRKMRQVAGEGEARLLLVIMLTAGALSAFMNNVGVTALLLPVVINIARSTNRPPSKLLLPLAFGCLLGGMTTLIGTPANILASSALEEYGLTAFKPFDFLPVGLTALLLGTGYMVLLGRRILPERDFARQLRQVSPGELYDIGERLFIIRLPRDSQLAGATLAESHLGSALNLNVIGIIHNGQTQLAPQPDAVLRGGDRLLVSGRSDQLAEMRNGQTLTLKKQGWESEQFTLEQLSSREIKLAELTLPPTSTAIGQTLEQIKLRERYGVNALAILRGGKPVRTKLQTIPLQDDDRLLVQAPRAQWDELEQSEDFALTSTETSEVYHLHERLLLIGIPATSSLAGKTLAQSRLNDAFGLSVVGIIREEGTLLMPEPEEPIQAGDTLLVEGKPEDVRLLNGLHELEIEEETTPRVLDLESERVGLAEAVLSPRSHLPGKTLRQVHFREKYGLSVLAIWRGGRAHRSNLRDMPLRFGDGLLIHGRREKLQLLASEEDFLMLTEELPEAPRRGKAVVAALVMGAVVLSAALGWLPIAIAALAGAALMVLFGSISMSEAYRSVEWKAIFLIAGMLPLGIAMETSGAARYIAEGVVDLVGPYGPLALLAGLFLLTTLASQVMPNPVVTVLMAPIALNTASHLGLSPYALMMTVALAASASFLSPISHPTNVLVMGPGSYRFSDYTKVGLPLTLLLLAITLTVLPVFWPLQP